MGEQLKTHVCFRSSRFPPNPDAEQALWNDELAEFLAAGLRARGFAADEPGAEDWGYRIDIENDDFSLWVGCGNFEEDDQFLVFVHPHEPEVRKLFKTVSTVDLVSKVIAALEAMLAEPGITDVEWNTEREWNNPTGS